MSGLLDTRIRRSTLWTEASREFQVAAMFWFLISSICTIVVVTKMDEHGFRMLLSHPNLILEPATIDFVELSHISHCKVKILLTGEKSFKGIERQWLYRTGYSLPLNHVAGTKSFSALRDDI